MYSYEERVAQKASQNFKTDIGKNKRVPKYEKSRQSLAYASVALIWCSYGKEGDDVKIISTKLFIS